MEKIVLDTCKTEDGYCCSCERIPAWIAAHTGDFDSFKAYAKESVGFYVECARKDGDKYDPAFDGEYELCFKMDLLEVSI